MSYSYYANESASWLSIKHHVPNRFSLECGARDPDFDFIDPVPYTFASEEGPIQLRNNYGGMDEDEVKVQDVWTPYQQMAAAAEEQIEPTHAMDSEMSDEPVSSGDDMDIDIDAGAGAGVGNNFNFQQNIQMNPVQQSNKKKRNFEDIDVNTAIAPLCAPQNSSFSDTAKRARVGA